MSFIIKDANKVAKKLRIGMSGPSGFGKTYSSLLLAYGICGDWSSICVIDTEKDSASLYSDLPKKIGDTPEARFKTIPFRAPYSPKRYVEAIKFAEANGAKVIIVDSISHEWQGKGGCLEIHSKLGGRFQDWGEVTPMHNAFIDSILESGCHVICCVRSKQGYEMTSKQGGGIRVQKAGLAPITREGFEYEMDVAFNIINDQHLVELSKDRTEIFDKDEHFIITWETGKRLKDWASDGRSAIDDALDAVRNTTNIEDLKQVFISYSEVKDHNDFRTAVAKKKKEFQDLAKAEELKKQSN